MESTRPEFLYHCSDEERQTLQAELGVEGNGETVLAGVRLGVKDLFHIRGLPTSAGNPSWLASHEVPNNTARVVKHLLQAGAELIGKTLTDELAYSLNGVNVHYGTPINAKANNRLPGGSSSGSAVAVANGSIDLGLGTDTGGSIRVPASYNGIVGFRPSHGVISLEGCIPLAPRFDTVGWLTRDTETLLKTARVILPKSYRKQFTQVYLLLPQGMTEWQHMAESLAVILATRFDAVNVLPVSSEFLSEASEIFRILQGREIWQTHGQWITNHTPQFSNDIKSRFDWCASLAAEQERQAEQRAKEFIDEWRAHFLPTSTTLAILPTTPGAAPLLSSAPEQLADYRNLLMGLTAPAGLLGAPQLSLPLLSNQQSPWGLSFLANKDCDWSLLNAAQELSTVLQDQLLNEGL